MYGRPPKVMKISPQKARAIIDYQLERKTALSMPRIPTAPLLPSITCSANA